MIVSANPDAIGLQLDLGDNLFAIRCAIHYSKNGVGKSTSAVQCRAVVVKDRTDGKVHLEQPFLNFPVPHRHCTAPLTHAINTCNAPLTLTKLSRLSSM